MLQTVYLIFFILGTVLPFSQFIPFLLERGLDLNLFFEQLFTNRISSFFGMDVIVSILVLLTFVIWSGVSPQDEIFVGLYHSQLTGCFLWVASVSFDATTQAGRNS